MNRRLIIKMSRRAKRAASSRSCEIITTVNLRLTAKSRSSVISRKRLPKSLSEFASSARTSVYSVEDADTAVAYVMAWARDIANPVARLFIDTVRKYAEGEDDIYDL